MSKRLLLVSPLILAFLATSPAYAQPSGHPPTLTLDGTTALPLAGQALRAHLLGEVDLYSVAVYVEGRISDFAHLSSPDVSKALRISRALGRTTASVGGNQANVDGIGLVATYLAEACSPAAIL